MSNNFDRVEKLIRSDFEADALLNVLQIFSNDTYNHSLRVAMYVYFLCEEDESIDANHKLLYTLGAALHDIGKLKIPYHIIIKPEKLTSEEWESMKMHPEVGYIQCVGDFPEEVLNCILYHHERGDGSGYPNGYTMDKIPVEGRILAVCDSFDAMTAKRPYKQRRLASEVFVDLYNDADKGIYERRYIELLEKAFQRQHRGIDPE